jgi:hypothetical protein
VRELISLRSAPISIGVSLPSGQPPCRLLPRPPHRLNPAGLPLVRLALPIDILVVPIMFALLLLAVVVARRGFDLALAVVINVMAVLL